MVSGPDTVDSNYEKNGRSKISLDCPFKVRIENIDLFKAFLKFLSCLWSTFSGKKIIFSSFFNKIKKNPVASAKIPWLRLGGRGSQAAYTSICNLMLSYHRIESILYFLLSVFHTRKMCCGSGSGSIFRSFLDPDPYSEYGSGSTHANLG